MEAVVEVFTRVEVLDISIVDVDVVSVAPLPRR